MTEATMFVGLDVHKATIAVATARPGTQPAESRGMIPNTPAAVAELVRKLGPAAGLLCCYEAGPCGYPLYRQLTALGATCVVVAPSLIPTKPGDKVKTDRRDAQKLARFLRAGELTPVWVPDPDSEALRDLTRAREAAQHDLVIAKNRRGKFLLRQDLTPPDGVHLGTQAYERWLQALRLDHPYQQLVFDELRAAVTETAARVTRLEQAIGDATQTSRQAPLIAALQTLHGVATITAAGLAAELGDPARFDNPRQLMAYAGLVPSEHSSGGSQHRGRITKTGNSHVRGLVVEAAWHYVRPPRTSKTVQRRQQGQPAPIVAISAKARQRLYRRYWRLVQRGKPPGQAVVAIARELLGFLWAIAREVALAVPTASAA